MTITLARIDKASVNLSEKLDNIQIFGIMKEALGL